jgi:hypothetical protein
MRAGWVRQWGERRGECGLEASLRCRRRGTRKASSISFPFVLFKRAADLVCETELISITHPIRTCTAVVVHSSISGTFKDRCGAVIVPRMSALCCPSRRHFARLEAGLPLPCCVGCWSPAGICLWRAASSAKWNGSATPQAPDL